MHEAGLMIRYALGVESFVAKGSIIFQSASVCDIFLLKGNIAEKRETASLDVLTCLGGWTFYC